MRKGVLVCLLVIPVWMTTGCETIKGVGRDITKAGEAIEDAAR